MVQWKKMNGKRVGWCCAAGALGVALLLSGCDNDRVAATEEGLTTQAQVMAQWGPPEKIWDGPDGNKIYEYNRQPQGTTNYMITIAPDGKVEALRQVLTRTNFDRVQPGMMMEDVRKMLGKPARIRPWPLKRQTDYEWRFREGHGSSQLFVVTFDADLKVLHTAITADPQDMQNPDSKP